MSTCPTVNTCRAEFRDGGWLGSGGSLLAFSRGVHRRQDYMTTEDLDLCQGVQYILAGRSLRLRSYSTSDRTTGRSCGRLNIKLDEQETSAKRGGGIQYSQHLNTGLTASFFADRSSSSLDSSRLGRRWWKSWSFTKHVSYFVCPDNTE